MWRYFHTPEQGAARARFARFFNQMALRPVLYMSTEETAAYSAFLGIIENAPFGIYVVDQDFRLAHISQGARRVFSGVKDAIGKDYEEVLRAIWPEPFVSELLAIVRHTLATGESYRAPSTVQQRADTADTEAYDWRVDRVRLPGDAWGLVFYFHDRTSEQRQQEQLERTLQASAARQAALLELSDAIRALRDPVALSYVASEILGRILGASRVGFASIDPDAETLHVETDWTAPDVESLAGVLQLRDYGSFIDSLKRDEFVGIPDVRLDERTAAAAAALERRSARSFVNVPVVEEGTLVGVLYVNHATVRDWTADEVALVKTVAERLRTALERLRAEEALRAGQLRNTFLLELTDALRLLADPVAIQERAAALLGEHLGATRVMYCAIDADEEHFSIQKDYAKGVDSMAGHYTLSGFTDNVLAEFRQGRRLVMRDVEEDTLTTDQRAAFSAIGTRSWMAVPLLKEGRLSALLTVHAARPRTWSADELTLLDDVAQRTWAALERSVAEAALARSEAEYRTLFDSIDEGFCTIQVLFDAQGHPFDYRFLSQNPAFEGQTGLKDNIGRTMRDYTPDMEQFWFDTYGAVALTGEAKRFTHMAAALGRYYDLYAFRVGEPDEHKVGVIFNDISERKRSEEALRESDRQKNEFLATLAHELRNPLAPLRNGLELLADSGIDRAAHDQAHGMMSRQLDQMVRLIDDLMDLSRITRGVVDLRKQPMDLRAAIQQAVETGRPLLDARAHAFTVALPEAPLPVEGDVLRLAQVFTNLLNNAAKYTDPGGNIDLHATIVGQEVVVTIIDNGIGIAPDQLNKVFDMFAQVERDTLRTQGGLGIGLNIVKHLVDMHGGRVAAASGGLGAGSAFTVHLPLSEKKAGAHGPTRAPKAVSQASQRILIADDNADAALSLSMILTRMGHVVEVAHNGEQALATGDRQHPQIVLLDIGMPVMDGHTACKRIRATAWGQQAFIVAITGWGQDEDRQRTAEAGFDRHLVKPIGIQDLRAVLLQAGQVAAN